MLVQCLTIVADAGQALRQRWCDTYNSTLEGVCWREGSQGDPCSRAVVSDPLTGALSAVIC